MIKTTTRKAPQRVFCEDTSTLLKSIRSAKDHGKTKVINGITYEIIGGDMLFNTKTNRIEKKVE
jgi:hypothetical protein